MAVISEHEIELNSIKYPITGQVRPILSAKFAEKMVIGDFTKASNPEVDSWVIQDQRGGILAEEMDEARQADRAYWSTCNLGFLGHITLPPKPSTAIALTAPSWASPTGFTETGWTNAPQAYDEDTGNYADIAAGADDWCAYLTLTIAATTIDGIRFWIDALNISSTEITKIEIDLYYDDNGGAAYHSVYTETYADASTVGKWQTAYLAAPQSVTSVQIRFYNEWGDVKAVRVNEVDFIKTTGGTAGTLTDAVEFNSQLYFAHGANLTRLNAAGSGLLARYVFAANITALVSDGSYLYVYLGDSDNYWYMSTSEVFLTSDEPNANKGIYWDSKLIKVNAAGLLAYATASPANDGTDWTTADTLPLTSGYLKTLFLYRDAAGEYTIYAATRTGLFAFDWTTKLWVETELTLPDHPTCGMGAIHWRDMAYVSAGLDVLRYQTGGSGTAITSVGLDRDDGLPKLRGGEIVKFIPGYNEFFALVDSTYEGATSRSTVMAYDNKGWQCWWESGSDDVHMYSGIVSSVYAYRLWFGAGASIYYITLQRNLRNPKKVTGFNYHTAGVHITPWFDANWVGTKLALQFKVFCKDTTAAEDVVVDYRIDHATTAIGDNGWTNLGTIETAGGGVETTYTFGDSLGTNFKAIQFRFTLASGTATLSPDIQYAVLEYQKIIKPTWGWAFTIDCTNAYAGRTADQMLDAVVTAAELEVLTPFLYKDTTYYVRVKSVEGERLTGDGRKGTYNVLVLKPI